ncbi:unnamed protein product [Amaranthus hypochondriacus]
MQMLKRELKAKFSKNHIEDQLREAERQLSTRQNQMHSNPLNPLDAELEQKLAEISRKGWCVNADEADAASANLIPRVCLVCNCCCAAESV